MIFPELRQRIKSLFPERPAILSLGLKAATSDFTPASAAWYAKNYPQIHALLSGGAPAWSNEVVSLTTALQHSVVWICNRIVSESVGFLPVHLMQRKGAQKQEAADHPMYAAMKSAPNDEMTAQTFRETLTSHCLLDGNGYSHIIRRSGTGVAMELHPLLPEQVRVDREKSGQRRLVYIVKDSNAAERTFPVEPGKPHDILHLRGLGWDGLRGYSVITMGRQSIGTAIAAERNVGRFWAFGGRVPFLLEMARTFKDDEAFQEFRQNFESIYSDPHRAPILENGTTYKQIGLNMRDAQALESRLYTVAEICRWFSVSPHLAFDLSHATFSNIEHLALEFVKMTLTTWLTRWEQEFWRCVLTPEEKGQNYFLRHNVNALLRGDFLTRMQGYSIMLQNAIASQNEVRDLEDWNPFEGGDDYHIQLNMQTLPADGKQPPSQSLVRLGKRPAAAAGGDNGEASAA